jgi:ribosomal protein S18 acetylase RimI-like enzyme
METKLEYSIRYPKCPEEVSGIVACRQTVDTCALLYGVSYNNYENNYAAFDRQNNVLGVIEFQPKAGKWLEIILNRKNLYEILNIAVYPNCRLNGIGSALVGAVENLAREEGAAGVTTARSPNIGPFWTSLNYKELDPKLHMWYKFFEKNM